jgi:hypothetical protein
VTPKENNLLKERTMNTERKDEKKKKKNDEEMQ